MAKHASYEQKIGRQPASNLNFRVFSPGEAYREGSVKSAPHLRECRFLAAIFPPPIASVHRDVTNIT